MSELIDQKRNPPVRQHCQLVNPLAKRVLGAVGERLLGIEPGTVGTVRPDAGDMQRHVVEIVVGPGLVGAGEVAGQALDDVNEDGGIGRREVAGRREQEDGNQKGAHGFRESARHRVAGSGFLQSTAARRSDRPAAAG